MVIETNRLIIRNFEIGDLESYYEFLTQPNVGPRLGYDINLDKDEALKRLKEESKKEDSYAIVLKEEEKVIGAIHFKCLENTDRYPFLKSIDNVREVNYLISEEYWNKGYMSEALEVVIATAFEVLNLDIIVSAYLEPNVASEKVQQKCGMKVMGKLKEYAPWYLNNEKVDLVISMITKEEYNKNKTDEEFEVSH